MLNASYMSAYVDHEQGWYSRKHGQSPALADLFHYFRTFEVTENKDRVYSLLSLTKWHFDQQPFPGLVTPDYGKPSNEVLRDATKAAIVETSDLWVFRYIDHELDLAKSNKATLGIPSWVPSLFHKPDFSIEPNPLRSPFKANAGMKDMLLQGIPDVDVAAPFQGPDLLTAQGLKISPIKTNGRPFGIELQSNEGLVNLSQSILLSGGNSELHMQSVEPYDRGLVLVAGSSFDPQPLEEGGEPQNVDSAFIEGIHTRSGEENLRAVVVDKRFSRYIWAIRFACINRRLFETEDGTFGLGPKDTRPGDILAVLAASSIPVILRQVGRDGDDDVDGPCYARGMMMGEAAKAAKCNGKNMRNFRFR